MSVQRNRFSNRSFAPDAESGRPDGAFKTGDLISDPRNFLHLQREDRIMQAEILHTSEIRIHRGFCRTTQLPATHSIKIAGLARCSGIVPAETSSGRPWRMWS